MPVPGERVVLVVGTASGARRCHGLVLDIASGIASVAVPGATAEDGILLTVGGQRLRVVGCQPSHLHPVSREGVWTQAVDFDSEPVFETIVKEWKDLGAVFDSAVESSVDLPVPTSEPAFVDPSPWSASAAAASPWPGYSLNPMEHAAMAKLQRQFHGGMHGGHAGEESSDSSESSVSSSTSSQLTQWQMGVPDKKKKKKKKKKVSEFRPGPMPMYAFPQSPSPMPAWDMGRPQVGLRPGVMGPSVGHRSGPAEEGPGPSGWAPPLDPRAFAGAPHFPSVDPASMLQFRMMQMLDNMDHRNSKGRKSKRHRKSSSSSSSNGDLRKFRGIRKLTHSHFKHARRLLKQFDADAAELIGVQAGQPWNYRNLTQAIGFGRMQGVFRIHAYLGDVLTALKTGQTKEALVICIQLMKGLHQMFLDGGSWETASLLLPTTDPKKRREFGGEDREMEIISAYRKSRYELVKAHQQLQPSGSNTFAGPKTPEGGEAGGGAKPKKGKGKGNEKGEFGE